MKYQRQQLQIGKLYYYIFQKNRSDNSDKLVEQPTDNPNRIPDFLIKCSIHNTVCRVQDPFIGDLIVEKSDLAIRSIELQLVRVEIITGEIMKYSRKGYVIYLSIIIYPNAYIYTNAYVY